MNKRYVPIQYYRAVKFDILGFANIGSIKHIIEKYNSNKFRRQNASEGLYYKAGFIFFFWQLNKSWRDIINLNYY